METFKKRWSFNTGLRNRERWKQVVSANNFNFLNTMKFGLTANICCGYDNTGDILIDIDLKTLKANKNSLLIPELKDYVCADMFNLPFRNNVFDTVICDPPFSYYNKLKWIVKLADLTRYKLILSSPSIAIKLDNNMWNKELYYIETPGLFLRLWWVFTRK
jgi:hypothetical protein